MVAHKIACARCGVFAFKESGAVNRARKIGAPLYCGRMCAGLARRQDRTKAEKVAAKRLYDMEYRRKNRALLKIKKAAYHQATYDPATAAKVRKANMARHVAYCQRPEYKEWKQKYDAAYRAKRLFGPFWESALLLLQLDSEILSRATRYEIALANGTLNKALLRRRDYERTVGYRP